ncbi:MAG: 4Fe-4S binding protein, partial [Flavisolibacter sp.]
MLKKIRVSLSLVIFSFITVYFLDFANLVPKQLHELTKLQLVPALLALNLVALLFIVGITLLFGRIYCSSLCPMGIFQDIVSWVDKKLHRKRKYRALRERPLLRWSIVVITILAFFTGASAIVSILDPYSAYGRMATNLFKPAYLEGNNLIAWIDNYFKHYRFYKVDVFFTSMGAVA